MHKTITTLKCRLCQEQQEVMIPIYDSTTAMTGQRSIPDMVSAFVGSEVERYDRLPKSICQMCHDQLVESHQFSLACRRARLELEQPQTTSDQRCLVCHDSVNEEATQENASACQRWGMSMNDMIQRLSGTVKRIKNLPIHPLVCESCLQKMDCAYVFKNRCLKSEANWLQKVSHPWERMEVDKNDPDQLVIELSADIVREQQGDQAGMGHCSVCLLEVDLNTMGKKCNGCLLPFRSVAKKSRIEAAAIEGGVAIESQDNEIETDDPDDVQEEIDSNDPPSENDSNPGESGSDSDDAQAQKDPRYVRVKTLVYRCCIQGCYNNHATEEDLINHYELVHGGSDARKAQKFYCQYCDRPFPNESFLLDHRKHRRIQYRCQIEGCNLTRSSEALILLHCNENPHRPFSHSKWDTLRKNTSIRKNLTPTLDHFEVIGSQDAHTDILKRKSEFCCRCFALFETIEERDAHCRAHGVQKDFPMHCETCGLGQPNKTKLVRHQNMRDQRTHYYCRTCDKMLWLKVSYSRHRGVYHFPKELEQKIGTECNDFIACCGCYETFTTEAAIQAHRKEKHPPTDEPTKAGQFKCDKCQMILKSLKQHDALNKLKLSYVCMVPGCAYRSKRKDRINAHILINVHRNAKGSKVYPQPCNKQTPTYMCCICPTHTETEYDKLIEHGRTLHEEKREYNRKTYVNRMFQCPVCLKGFDQRVTLVRHKQRIKRFFCTGCAKWFFNTEMMSHSTCAKPRKVKCELCDKLLSSEKTLESHLKNVHSANREETQRSVCFVCGKMVRNLQFHMSSHENKRSWECNICHARFNSFEVLTLHQRVHNGLRKYGCRHGCDKRYKASGDRDRHEKLVHLGITPFGCDLCESSFVRERDLRLHMRKHTGQKLYPCGQCKAGFNRKMDFEKHVQEHTGQSRVQEEC
ncbi:zinc finger protein 271 isoform X3 [Aedes albopictus]|uniref:C2h2-type zn-finger protein n=1 Tax=Aedes albopictus TaxID=7160 RepID=A0ABM2A6X2_AEDAL|nr:zinc finger protein 271-like isoform X3 [Aedes albopictus]